MENIVLWGASGLTKQILTESMTISDYNVLGIVDNDAGKHGINFYGVKVFSADFILENREKIDAIVILANAYNEIYDQIVSLDKSYIGRVEDRSFFYKRSIMKRYANSKDSEIQQILKYLSCNKLGVFNYDFVKKYCDKKYNVYLDEECGLFYVIHKGMKMYFTPEFKTKEQVENYYNSVCLEQDEESPHRYITEDFVVKPGSVVIDAGVAEGNFSLEIIERVKKLYIIETDPGWIQALKHTFEKYMDKVCIIEKYITSYDEGKYAKLDSLINQPVDFIKMDIEGNEWDALRGAASLIDRSENISMAICCYHSDFDQTLIENQMDIMGVSHTTSKGYMWYPWKMRQTYISTSLNRALVRGVKLCIHTKNYSEEK